MLVRFGTTGSGVDLVTCVSKVPHYTADSDKLAVMYTYGLCPMTKHYISSVLLTQAHCTMMNNLTST